MWESYRNEETFEPMSYYFKAPRDLADSDVFLVDPMLATGNSAADAATKLKAGDARRLRLIALLGCVTGALHFKRHIPRCRSSWRRSTKNLTNAPTLSLASATPETVIARRRR